ncbi:Myb-like DNA-binding domain protein [Aspergillus sclerotialis]|uniref:Myb-like DNA-binding domain protein n=1 Tax=Aspergillus sclerotialis TaxID=2070753 RepID=A0A3A3A1P8_9EURO|nr:Myb-like DNA-binding domain protein [Aspergillus sclerotialis]
MEDPIERASKRPRLSNATAPGSQADSLDLQKARHQNDLNLKSIFENIFAKYENDFTEVGDEINLETGEIVVNNGHIGLITETSLWDPEIEEPESDGEAYDEEVDGDVLGSEEKDFIENIGAGGDAGEEVEPVLNAPTSSELHGREVKQRDSRWDFPSFENEQTKPVDPIWNIPDFDGKLSTPAFNKPPVYPTSSYSFIRSASPLGASDIWALPKRGRPSTGGVKRYKNAGAKKKRKPRASAVTTDWSFAEISDGNDSDDPLNEEQDHLQSPTPKGIFNLRGRKAKPVARDRDGIGETEVKAADVNGSSPDKRAISPTLGEQDVAESREEICDTPEVGRDPTATDSLSNIPNDEHDITETGVEGSTTEKLTNNSNNANDIANTEDLATTNASSDNMDDKHGIVEVEEFTATNVLPINTDDVHNPAEAGAEDTASVTSNDIEEEFDVSDDEMELVPINGPTSNTQPLVPAPNEPPNPSAANTPEPKPKKRSLATDLESYAATRLLTTNPKLNTTERETTPETCHT